MNLQFFKKFFLILIIFIIFLLIFDRDWFLQIGLFNEKEKKNIIDTIVTYNKILMDFYATGGNPSLIDEMPTSKYIKHEIFKEIAFLSASKMVLVYDLTDIKIEKINFFGLKMAKAKVDEEWNYQYQDLGTREAKSDIKGGTFKVEYDLKKIKGKWIILQWKPLN